MLLLEVFDICDAHDIPVVLLSAGLTQVIHEVTSCELGKTDNEMWQRLINASRGTAQSMAPFMHAAARQTVLPSELAQPGKLSSLAGHACGLARVASRPGGGLGTPAGRTVQPARLDGLSGVAGPLDRLVWRAAACIHGAHPSAAKPAATARPEARLQA